MSFTFDLNTLLSVAFGSAVTWWVARVYYKRAGLELAREPRELRRLSTLILHALQEAGLVKFTKDAGGNIAGLVIHLRGRAVDGVSDFAKATLTVKPPGPSVPYKEPPSYISREVVRAHSRLLRF